MAMKTTEERKEAAEKTYKAIQKRSKYGAKKVTVDGYTFDSKDEAAYYRYLLKLKAQGKIFNFELQPKFVLIPSFKYKGKTIRAATYTLDFLIYHLDGREEYVDVKSLGSATQQGEFKFKLLKYQHLDKDFKWMCRSLKYGDEDGWIEYDDLKKIRREKKKNVK